MGGAHASAGAACGCSSGRPNANTTGRSRGDATPAVCAGGAGGISSGDSLQAARLARTQLAAA